jgi:hypothetical protein
MLIACRVSIDETHVQNMYFAVHVLRKTAMGQAAESRAGRKYPTPTVSLAIEVDETSFARAKDSQPFEYLRLYHYIAPLSVLY